MKTISISSSAVLALCAALSLIPSPVLRAADEALPPSKPQSEEAQAPRLVSLVLLLSEARTLDAAAVAKAASHADGEKVAEDAVTAQSPSFIVKTPAGRFAVSTMAEPYFEASDKLAAELKDPTLADAIRKHRAWLSVDWIDKDEKADLRKVYQQVGKIIGQLVQKDTLAVYSPETDQFHINDATLPGHLKSDDPLQDLAPAGVAGAEDGEISISSDDPKLIAAQDEAEKNWPEFLAAYKARTKGQYFAVKGRLQEGEKGEYLWIQVSDIDDKLVHGKLDNDPTTLKKVTRGADLHVSIADVDDWLYSTGAAGEKATGKEEIKGGYTLRVFDQIEETKVQK